MSHSTAISRSIASLFALGLLVSACGGSDSDEASSDDTQAPTDNGGEVVDGPLTINIVDFAYDPEAVTIAAGTEFTFVNQDSQPHTATTNDTGVFDTDSLATDESKTFTVDEAGEYTYFCSFHPFMKASIVVE